MTLQHLPYSFQAQTKYSHYEALWKASALDLLNRHIPSAKRSGARILDVGCGRGEMMEMLSQAGYQAEGFDVDEKCVELGSRYGHCKQGDVNQISGYYSEREFDAVVSLHVIEHLENPKNGIAHFGALSKEYILLATPNLSSFPLISFGRKVGLPNAGHIGGWNHAHLRNLLETILGLEIVSWATDCVRLYDRLPKLQWFDNLLHKSGVRALFEEKLLKALFPNLSNSLIVLARRKV